MDSITAEHNYGKNPKETPPYIKTAHKHLSKIHNTYYLLLYPKMKKKLYIRLISCSIKKLHIFCFLSPRQHGSIDLYCVIIAFFLFWHHYILHSQVKHQPIRSYSPRYNQPVHCIGSAQHTMRKILPCWGLVGMTFGCVQPGRSTSGLTQHGLVWHFYYFFFIIFNLNFSRNIQHILSFCILNLQSLNFLSNSLANQV